MESRRSSRKRRVLNHIGKVALGIVSASFVLSPYSASAIDAADATSEVVGSEGGKKIINKALTVAGSKSALSVATVIVCAAAVVSPGLCVASCILIAKTFG